MNHKKLAEEALKEMGFFLDEKGKIITFNANFFAHYICLGNALIFADGGRFHEYDEGKWWELNHQEVKSFLYDEIERPRPGVWNTKRENEYFNALQRYSYKPIQFNEHRHLINMENGMFDTEKLKLIPHDPEFYSTIQVPIWYDKDADCPKFKKYLDDVFESDKERISKAIEWLGYCLSTETKAQKALILFGGGGNGKGVFTEILSMLVGTENLSHVPLNELSNCFSRVTLFGKTINISSENEMGGKSFNTQYFKAIVGEDTINAADKNKPVFSFKPTVKMVIAMNNLPQTKDRSDGFYRRLDFLTFDKHFSGDNADKDLKRKLEAELAGIFNLAISGLVRLRKNNFKFSDCKASDKMLEEYKEELNPMITFFDECVEKAEIEYREDNKLIYNGFKKWAEDNGHKGYSNVKNQRFWREFESESKSREWETESGRSNAFRYHTGVRYIGTDRQNLVSRHGRRKPHKSRKVETVFEPDEE